MSKYCLFGHQIDTLDGVGTALHRQPFPTTQWTLVKEAAEATARHPQPSLQRLLCAYLPALQSHLATRGLRQADADDLLQQFITSRLLEKQLLSKADRHRGRFRNLLLTSLDGYLIDGYRAQRSRSKHELAAGADAHRQANAAQSAPCPFDVMWAKTVLTDATARTRAYFVENDRDDLWRIFDRRVLVPILTGTPVPPYQMLVDEFGFRTAEQACSAVVTARRAFVRILREVIAEYVSDPAEIEDEINDLRRILAEAR